MDHTDALRILSSLADGIDPQSGEPFPPNSPYQRLDVTRALFAAIRALECAPSSGRERVGNVSRAAASGSDRLPRTLELVRATYPVTAFHPLLITEVTRMQHDFYCIAAYDVHGARMARPLRPKGENWIFDAFQDRFLPGQLVNVTPAEGTHGPLPHANEDLLLQGGMDVLDTWSLPELYYAMLPLASASISKLFHQAPTENRYLPEAVECPSLGSIRIARSRIEFRSNSNNRLRLRVTDNDDTIYSLPVTCDRLRTLFDPEGGLHTLAEANAWLETIQPEEPVVLRIGLTRPYAGADGEYSPRRCYVQINGLLSARPYPGE